MHKRRWTNLAYPPITTLTLYLTYRLFRPICILTLPLSIFTAVLCVVDPLFHLAHFLWYPPQPKSYQATDRMVTYPHKQPIALQTVNGSVSNRRDCAPLRCLLVYDVAWSGLSHPFHIFIFVLQVILGPFNVLCRFVCVCGVCRQCEIL